MKINGFYFKKNIKTKNNYVFLFFTVTSYFSLNIMVLWLKMIKNNGKRTECWNIES